MAFNATRQGGKNQRSASAKRFQGLASPRAVILLPCAKLPPPTRVNSRENTAPTGRLWDGDISVTSGCEHVERSSNKMEAEDLEFTCGPKQ